MTHDIVLLDPPGAGKSTQAADLSERLGIPYLTAADALPPGGCVLDGQPSTLLAARRLTRRRSGAARRRIVEYRAAIAPVLAFFEARMLLHRVDASGAPAEVRDAIARAIGLTPLPEPPCAARPVRHVHAMDAMAAAHGYLVQRDDD